MNALMTYEDAARELRMSPATLRNWVSAKKIPYIKIGRFVRFREEDLEEYLESRRQPALRR